VIELPRSTFYYRAIGDAGDLADDHLVELIQTIQDELPGYGYRRVTHELRRRGHVVNHKRVARLMKAHSLGIKPRRRFVRTTDSNHDSPIFPNLYRNVILSRPDLVWVADFTYIRIATGFCYWSPSSMRAAAMSWATRSPAALTRRWRWRRYVLRSRADDHRQVAFTIRIAAVSTPATRTGERCGRLGFAVR